MAEIDWHATRIGQENRLNLNGMEDEDVDLVALCDDRLNRVRKEMAPRGIAACILFDPVNIRYATGARNMQVFHSRNPARYLLVTVEGPVILYEFTGCMHLANGLETITEVRPAITASFVAAGPGIVQREKRWAQDMASTLTDLVGRGATIGIERANAGAVRALAAEDFQLVDAQEPVERARAIKGLEELKCIRTSIRAVERATEAMRAALEPGLTENELWSILHQGVIAQGGDYVETRLLSSGRRTNPWFQECGSKVIGKNEIVALDTDVVGCYGYYCDFSRSFHVGPRGPTKAQRVLYNLACEQVEHNMGILKAGMTFREYAEKAWSIPERYLANRYYVSAHGVGMTGEYPYLYHLLDFPEAGYDGIIEPGMTICVESYIGEEGGAQGVKLEQQVLITETGTELLSQFPFEDDLLGREV
ncbi:MAG: M24 family metallopeptidase [Paracoccaceae bacterium]